MELIFTQHSLSRMLKRQITKDEIIFAIKYPDFIQKKKASITTGKSLAEGL